MEAKKNELEGRSQHQQLEDLASVLVPESIAWIEELRNYRKYKGADARYFQKARLGVNVIGHAVRVCATIENSRTNDFIAARTALALPPETKTISG